MLEAAPKGPFLAVSLSSGAGEAQEVDAPRRAGGRTHQQGGMRGCLSTCGNLGTAACLQIQLFLLR